MGKNDVTWGKLTALVCHPTKKVNKARELTKDIKRELTIDIKSLQNRLL